MNRPLTAVEALLPHEGDGLAPEWVAVAEVRVPSGRWRSPITVPVPTIVWKGSVRS